MMSANVYVCVCTHVYMYMNVYLMRMSIHSFIHLYFFTRAGRSLLALACCRIPARCSFVGVPGDESALSGGILVEVREPERAAQLAASLDTAAPGLPLGETHKGGDALIRTVLAQAAGMSEDAARWRVVADARYSKQLMQTLIVAGHRLGQAYRHQDSSLLLVLALQVDAQQPAYQDALEMLGVALQYGSHLHCAEAMHARALALSGDRALPHLNIGLLKLHSGRETEAQRHLQRAIALACGHPSAAIAVLCAPALQGLGSALAILGQPLAACRLFLACARLAAQVECYMSASAVSQELGHLDEAISYLVRALGLLHPPSSHHPTPPDLAAFLLSISVPLSLTMAPYLEDTPFPPALKTTHIHTQEQLRWLSDPRVRVCLLELALLLASVGDFRAAWLTGLVQLALELDLQQGSVPPKAVNAVLFLPVAEHLTVPLMRALAVQAETRMRNVHHTPLTLSNFAFVPHRQNQVEVALLSSDFGQTVMLSFLSEPLKRHHPDYGNFRTRWRYVSLNGEAHAESHWRQELIAAAVYFDEFHAASDEVVAEALNKKQLAVIVFLDGHNSGSRISILGFTPAPLQVAYRFAATTGARFLSHYIGDAVVAPPELSGSLFSEKMVLLPVSYLPNSLSAKFAALPPPDLQERLGRREEVQRLHKVPADRILLACFNRALKIDALTFQVWMRLMRRFPQTVLWLVQFPPESLLRLRRAATAAGVAGDRLLASPMAAEEDFLDMSTAADVFLDTPACNAHTTASYALWAGTPIVTLALRRLVSRVGASLAIAASTASAPRTRPSFVPAVAGVTGIARDLADYELLAVAMVRQRAVRGAHQFELWRDAELAKRRRGEIAAFDADRWVHSVDRGLAMLYEAAAHAGATSAHRAAHMHMLVA
jgi:tetratricopeptide (TPR) repeat protein